MRPKFSKRLVQSFDGAEFLDGILALGCRLEKHLHVEARLVSFL